MIGRIRTRVARLAVALVAASGVLALAAGAASATEILYTNLPTTLPGNLPSVGFEATGTSEFGGLVKFGSAGEGFTDRNKAVVTVEMSSWQCQSGTWFEHNCVTSAGAKVPTAIPVTLNLYEVGELSKPRWTVTKAIKMPYRPSASSKCTGEHAGQWFDARNKGCYNGKLFKIKLSLAKAMHGEKVPAEAVISVAFNTTDYGYNPTHEAGDPADNLNVATSPESPSLGTQPQPADAFLTSAFEAEYCGSGVTPGTFGVSTGCWAGFQPAFAVRGSS
jgi:hypothetical protein